MRLDGHEKVGLHGLGFFHAAQGARVARRHALPLHKLVVPLDGCRLWVGLGGREYETDRPLWVPASVPQSVRSDGPTLALFWGVVARLATGVRHLRSVGSGDALAGGVRVLGKRDADRLGRVVLPLYQASLDVDPAAVFDEAGRWLLRARPMESRVTEFSQSVLDMPDTLAGASELARRYGLSRSRFSHLFQQQTGVSLRSMTSFMRLRRAVVQLSSSDAGIARVAAEAGFSDQAHLTRMCRSKVGRTPAAIQQTIRVA